MNNQTDASEKDLPAGTVTFLFTDIEGSTKLLHQLGEGYVTLLAEHHRMLREAFARYNGREVDTEGDAFFVSFPRATDAISAVVAAQRALAKHKWPEGVRVQVRMGLHTGEPWMVGEGYVGMDVHRAERIAHVGYGGQILLSETIAALVRDHLPDGTALLDLGRHRLKDIEEPERITQLVIPGLPSDYPPLKSLEAIDAVGPSIEHNLPVQSTPFVGRLRELTAIEALLDEPGNHLVTIVGPGGMGKTRLAIAYAERQLKTQTGASEASEPRYRDGVFFVSLDELESAEQIVPQMANALGLRLTSSARSASGMAGSDRSSKEQVLDYLSNKQLLLVMDNYEHLLENARLLVEIRQRAPGIKMLATSRERLGIHGEQLYPLHGMRAPTEDDGDIMLEDLLTKYSATQLFIQTAKRQEPDYTLAPGDSRDLARLCHMVDGLPLALELAAGWIDMLSMSDVVDELSRGMDLLDTGMVDIPERHRSMEAVFQSTWARLEPAEQRLFAQLCIFRGGFTREAAHEVTGGTLRQLGRLLNKSLLLYDRKTSRYRIHRLLRNFGHEMLARDPQSLGQTSERYCTFFCEHMAHWGESLKGTGQREALEEMESDSQNLRAAWNWAVSQGYVGCIDKSVEALYLFYTRSARVSQLAEVFNVAEEALGKKEYPAAKLTLAKVLAREGWFLDDMPDLQLVEHSLDLIAEVEGLGEDVRGEKAFALYRKAGLMRAVPGSGDESAQYFDHSLSIYEELDDRWGMANVLESKGHFALGRGNFEEAGQLFDQSLKLRRELGDGLGEINSLRALAGHARYTGRQDRARELEEHCIALHRQESNQLALASTLGQFGLTLFWLGEFQQSRAAFKERDSIFIKLGLSQWLQTSWTDEVNALYLGEYESLRRFRDVSPSNYDSWGLAAMYVLMVVGTLAIVRQQYSDACALLNKAIDLASEFQHYNDIGTLRAMFSAALWRMGAHVDAKSELYEALRETIEMKSDNSLMHVLPFAALILTVEKQLLRAVELYEVALTFPLVANAKLFEDLVGNEIATIANRLDASEVEDARQRGRERDPWAVAEELLADLESEMATL